MDHTQFIIFILTFVGFILAVVGLFLWNRAEGRADNRHMDAKLEGQRNLMMAIHQEMKDFHGRLCAIEERNRLK
jgi:uncharacterized membrane protein